MGGPEQLRAPARLVLGAAVFVGLLSAGAAALARAIEHAVGSSPTWGLGTPSAFALALASGFFVAAGVMRLSRWRLAQDPQSAMAGGALLVMGGLCLPVGGFALMFPTSAPFSLVGPGTRTLAELIVIVMLLRALTMAEVSAVERPVRLVPSAYALVLIVFTALVLVQEHAPHVVTGKELPTLLLGVLRPAAWVGVAMVAAARSAALPWARRVTPLFLGMGLAEAMRSVDTHHVGTWTLAGLLLCLMMAVLSARSALLDLDAAVRDDEHRQAELASTLTAVRDEADGLSEWREQLTHDASNACAGLRAALSILERYDGQVDPATREKLRLAAVQELGHIEHLLTRSPAEPLAAFDVREVLNCVAEAARAIGAEIAVEGAQVRAVGRAGDLVAALKNLLVNAQTHAAGSAVLLSVVADGDTVTVTCADRGPGLSAIDAIRAFDRGYRGPRSEGSGLGLFAARELMRDQGGELALAPSDTGAIFVLTLPRAHAPARHLGPVRVPSQRGSTHEPHVDPAREVPVA
ncbi:MAG: HAMP domain-containing sensor histidine kinase [Marmoricola sp.]